VAEAERRAAAATLLSDDPSRAEHFVTMMAHLGRGKSLVEHGDLVEADADLRRAVELSHRGAGRLERAYALLASGDVRQALGEGEEARELVRDARQILAGCPDPGILRAAVSALERRLSLAPAAEAAGGGVREELSDRELAVLRLLATGLSRREIGGTLYVSLNTVKTHTRGIFRKLGVSTRADAVRRARELGLL
jgi:LuxR family maltose regulon positive regulatory protein